MDHINYLDEEIKRVELLIEAVSSIQPSGPTKVPSENALQKLSKRWVHWFDAASLLGSDGLVVEHNPWLSHW